MGELVKGLREKLEQMQDLEERKDAIRAECALEHPGEPVNIYEINGGLFTMIGPPIRKARQRRIEA